MVWAAVFYWGAGPRRARAQRGHGGLVLRRPRDAGVWPGAGAGAGAASASWPGHLLGATSCQRRLGPPGAGHVSILQSVRDDFTFLKSDCDLDRRSFKIIFTNTFFSKLVCGHILFPVIMRVILFSIME